jgi:hypothetical protein
LGTATSNTKVVTGTFGLTADTKAEAGTLWKATSNAKVVEGTLCTTDGIKLAKVILSTYFAVAANNKPGSGTLWKANSNLKQKLVFCVFRLQIQTKVTLSIERNIFTGLLAKIGAS